MMLSRLLSHGQSRWTEAPGHAVSSQAVLGRQNGATAPLIRAVGLEVAFREGAYALRDVNLEVREGEFVAIIGPSGAGKTTLLRCLNGLVRPTKGRVYLDGLDITTAQGQQLRQARRQTGMVFQQFQLVGKLSVRSNVLCGRLGYISTLRGLLGLFPREDQKVALRCLQRVGLVEKADRRADTLSGGEQQRVAIARALAQTPRIILADEPIASVDIRLTQEIMDILRAINQEDGMTVVVSLHRLDLAKAYAHRIVALKDGYVVYDGSPQGITPEFVEEIYGGATD